MNACFGLVGYGHASGAIVLEVEATAAGLVQWRALQGGPHEHVVVEVFGSLMSLLHNAAVELVVAGQVTASQWKLARLSFR